MFVASSRLCDLASFPLVSRTLLATPLEQLRSAEIEQGLAASGSKARAALSTPPPARRSSGDAAQALAQAIATLRASQTVAYGAPTAEQGFKQPAARIAITGAGPQGQAGYSIELGAEIAGGRYARRSDQPITFVFPKEQIGRLLAAP